MSESEKKKLNIYLDHCCYNRPYDDQSQLRVEFETKAERFISLVIKEPIDYTEWRRNMYDGMSVRELSSKAMEYHTEIHK